MPRLSDEHMARVRARYAAVQRIEADAIKAYAPKYAERSPPPGWLKRMLQDCGLEAGRIAFRASLKRPTGEQRQAAYLESYAAIFPGLLRKALADA